MNRSLQFRIDMAKLVFQGIALANLWDNAASSPLTDLYLSLLTGDPGTGNDQTTNETTYGSYARIAVPRDSSGWTIDPATGLITPTSTITGVAPTSGSGTITHVGLGKAVSGAGYLFMVGTLTPNIILTIGVAPEITTTSQIGGT